MSRAIWGTRFTGWAALVYAVWNVTHSVDNPQLLALQNFGTVGHVTGRYDDTCMLPATVRILAKLCVLRLAHCEQNCVYWCASGVLLVCTGVLLVCTGVLLVCFWCASGVLLVCFWCASGVCVHFWGGEGKGNKMPFHRSGNNRNRYDLYTIAMSSGRTALCHRC